MNAEVVPFPDSDEIRPARPIPQSEITRVINLHNQMLDLRRMALNRAIDIGFKLRCWRDLIPHGKWLQWCRANLSTIHERTIRNYIDLWDEHELIRNHFKSESVSDLDEVAGVREALDFLAHWRAEHAKAPSCKKLPSTIKAIQKADSISEAEQFNQLEAIIEAGLPEATQTLDALDRLDAQLKAHPVSVRPELLARLCPVCRALLENLYPMKTEIAKEAASEPTTELLQPDTARARASAI